MMMLSPCPALSCSTLLSPPSLYPTFHTLPSPPMYPTIPSPPFTLLHSTIPYLPTLSPLRITQPYHAPSPPLLRSCHYIPLYPPLPFTLPTLSTSTPFYPPLPFTLPYPCPLPYPTQLPLPYHTLTHSTPPTPSPLPFTVLYPALLHSIPLYSPLPCPTIPCPYSTSLYPTLHFHMLP